MGKFFGSEPRYSREEIERQAQEAIDARVGLGRPPAEDWVPLEARLSEIDRAMAARPPVPPLPEPPASRPSRSQPQPIQVREVRIPKAPVGASAAPAARSRAGRRPLAATPSAN